MAGPVLVPFKKDDYLDIVKALRNIADQIERGEHGDIRMGILVLEGTDGRYDPWTFGPLSHDNMRALGLWRMGEDYLIQAIVDENNAKDL